MLVRGSRGMVGCMLYRHFSLRGGSSHCNFLQTRSVGSGGSTIRMQVSADESTRLSCSILNQIAFVGQDVDLKSGLLHAAQDYI